MVAFYKHNISAWRGGTASLTHEQFRAYHVIVEQIYLDEGPIPIHPRMLAGIANMTERSFKRALDDLVSLGKLSIADGRIDNVRAENELKTIRVNRENAKSGGISSGKARRDHSGETGNHNDFNGSYEAPLPAPMKPIREEKRREEKESPSNPLKGGSEPELFATIEPAKEPRRKAQSETKERERQFEEFRAHYPKRAGDSKERARKAFDKAMDSEGAKLDELERGADAYHEMLKRTGKAGTGFVKMTATWLNDKGWRDDYGQQSELIRNGGFRTTV